jgi:hypothetical protein
MTKKFVRVLADVDCTWEGLDPVYRVYVNDELFTERTWIWDSSYLEENLQIDAEPGEYRIRFELVPPHLAQLTVSNIHVDFGPGTVENNVLRITNEAE